MPSTRNVTSGCFLVILITWGGLEPQGSPGFTAPEDVGAILDGVREIAAPGVPGALLPFGAEAFSIVVGGKPPNQQTVVAAARLEAGRIVALGHDGYFTQKALEEADTARFLLNALRWLARGQQPKVAVLGLDDFATFLNSNQVATDTLDPITWPVLLGGHNVFVTTWSSHFSPEQVQAVANFIRNGGGFLSGNTPWGWLQLNPGKSLSADHPGNRLLAQAGLVWVDGTVEPTTARGYLCDGAVPDLVHAKRALDAVEAYASGRRNLRLEDVAQASQVITRAALDIPVEDTTFRPRLMTLKEQHAANAVPSPHAPLKVENILARLSSTLQLHEMQNTPIELSTPHPAAQFFPGAVPGDAPRVSKTLKVDSHIRGWHSTGLYAAAGEVVEIRVPETAVNRGLFARLGCHTDTIWHHPEWKRAPDITRRFALSMPITRIANPFGGLVYIEVPDNCDLGRLIVQITGAVEAPRFVLGETDPATWRKINRSHPAPWAELESRNIILTVPSDDIRALDNPVPLLEFWTAALDACAELAAIPRERDRPERMVADVQISAGYMHSGYPIMTHLDAAKIAVDVEQLKTKGSWGHFHEIGHNHQSGHWTFDGTGEVTVNLFSLYILDRCCHVNGSGHPAIEPETRATKTAEYIAVGAPFERWKSDPFLALYMYMQLQEAFGWEAFKRVFAEYRAAPESELPKSDDEKRDQWMVRFSLAVGRNLAPFFNAWGIPTSEHARASIAGLPEWMPEGFPPKA